MKVLIVDDDKAALEFMADAVENEGHHARTAENGEVGLQVFDEFKPDLVLTDIQMPRVDGLELLKKIRKTDQQTKIIVATAFGSEDFAKQALMDGANGYLNKPIRVKELSELMQEYDDGTRRSVIENEIEGHVHSRSFSMTADNRMERVPEIAAYLVKQASAYLSDEAHAGVYLGLHELISNAIEHGNLAISSDEKNRAISGKFGSLLRLYRARSSNLDFKRRLIHIKVSMSSECCEWTIRDEGQGFDWKGQFQALDGQESNAHQTRGIYLCRMRFDEMEYVGNGNEVRVKKFAHPMSKRTTK